MGIAIDGIGGFPTDGIVEKLIALEKRPGYLLAQKQKDIDAGTKVFQNLNSQLAALTTNAWGIFGKKDKLDKTSNPMDIWAAVKGTSSNKAVSVEAEKGARAGSVEFDVKQLAQSRQIAIDAAKLEEFGKSVKEKGGYFSIRIGDSVTAIKAESNSAQDMAKAINSVKGLGVSATALRIGDGTDGKGEYVLQITGKEIGAEKGDFQVYAGDMGNGRTVFPSQREYGDGFIKYSFGGPGQGTLDLGAETELDATVTREAQDAEVLIHGSGVTGLDGKPMASTFSSNTIELLDKVKVNIANVVQEKNSDGSPVDKNFLAKGIKVDVTEDSGVATGKVEAMVGSLNKILGTLHQGMKSVEKIRREEDGTESKWKAPGPLSNSIGRMVQSRIGAIMSDGITIKDAKGNSQTYALKDMGIELNMDKDSKEMSINFDSAKFKELTEKSPEVAQKLATALGEKVGAMGSQLSDSKDGILTQSIENRKTESAYYDRRIDDFQIRINAKEASMKKQYARLQTALAAFGQKQAWLQGQLAQLNGGAMGGK